MFFRHVFEPGLAQNSYVIGCQATGEALVIDPRRDIEIFRRIADENDLRITHVAETHIHADFLSGARELAHATGARLLLSAEGGADWTYQFEHEPLHDGESFQVGNLRVEAIHTPGHTPEHLSFVLYDLPSGPDPVMVFTGDFVFVGDVGRPDLLEEAAGIRNTKVAGARQLYKSLDRFRRLPEYVQVWPAHGAGSACGKALGAVPSSTVGYELRRNWAFSVDSEDEFVRQLLEGQPEPPLYFAVMKGLNKTGPTILDGLPNPRILRPEELDSLARDGAQVVDVRDRYGYAGGHIPESLSIPADLGLSTWAGWLLDYEKPIVLVSPDSAVAEVVTQLVRVGLDRVVGYLPRFDDWADAGYLVETTQQTTAEQIDGAAEDFAVLDVRSRSEYEESHIPGSQNIHVGHLRRRAEEIPRDRRLLVHCQAGYRSMIASSVLQRLGFSEVVNLIGGYDAWERTHGERQESTSEAYAR